METDIQNMKRRKRVKKVYVKLVILTVFLISFAAVLIWYFRPLKLSELITGDQELCITHIVMEVKDGEAYTDSQNYNAITEEQKNDIIELLETYSYQREWGTFFSDGSLQGLGNELLHLFVYEEKELVCTISISDTGSAVIHDKTYNVKHAGELMDHILNIVSQ